VRGTSRRPRLASIRYSSKCADSSYRVLSLTVTRASSIRIHRTTFNRSKKTFSIRLMLSLKK
jgi:hypothetical protein